MGAKIYKFEQGKKNEAYFESSTDKMRIDSSRKDEVLLGSNNNNLIPIDINLYTVIKSVCKIIKNNLSGTGFLIKLYKNNKEFYCLMSNEHVIKKHL